MRLLMTRYITFALFCLLLLPGVSAWAQETNLAVGSDRDPVYQALTGDNVYIDPRLNGTLNQQQLEQAAMQGQDNPHTRIKIAVLAQLPSEYLAAIDRSPSAARSLHGRERAFYAFRLYNALALGKNGLVLVVLHGRDDGVTVWTMALDKTTRAALATQYASAISSNPTQGTAQLAEAVAGDINGKEYRSTTVLWIIFLLVVLAVGWLLVSASRRRKQQLALTRGPIDALRGNVLSGIEYLDGYADVLPKNNPDSDQVRMYRQAASGKYDQAVKILDRATEMTDLNRAQGLLDRAQADVQSARRALDRATGGTGNIPGDDALRPEPMPKTQAAVQAIPQNQRGVSFFSGQPAPVSALVPVTITVNGQSRQVLVTPEEADEMRQGRMPQVRAFQNNGQYVPWYEYNGYDPYNDYWRYQNSGWNNFATGFIAADVLESLTQPHYMGGYGQPYAFATDMPYYQDYAQQSPDFGYASGYGDSSAIDTGNQNFDGGNGGGGDFFNNDSTNFDTSGFDDAGGGNFMDSGGSDFGGGDFGGGDFGGGGGDF